MTNAREIVSRCLQNDAAAQKQLYQHYAPQMLALCYRYTKDTHEASDVLQEGLLGCSGAWRNGNRKGNWGPGSEGSW